MLSSQRNINNGIITKNEPQTHREIIIPKINLSHKLINLPILNTNTCFSDRIKFNANKKLEDKKIRNKYEIKNNNKLKIKYLSLNKRKSRDEILFFLKNIKIKNDNIIKKKDTEINDNNNIIKNIETKNYKTPKKLLKNILVINEPLLSHNNIYTNINIGSIKDKIEENKYFSVKTENNKIKSRDKLLVHNIYFKWTMNNLNKIISKNNSYDIYDIPESNKSLNNSYDLSLNSYSSKNLLNKNKKIFNNDENKKIKSADVSRKNDTEINSSDLENEIKNVFNYNIKLINEENIDRKNINQKIFKNLIYALSKKQKLNKSLDNKKFSNINLKLTENNFSNSNEKNDFKNILLENKDNFLYKFLIKYYKKYQIKNKEITNNKEIIQNPYIDNNIMEAYSFRKSFSKKEKEVKKEENKINNNHHQIHNKSSKNYDIRKKHYNIILISSPGNITKEKKEIFDSFSPIRKSFNYSHRIKTQKKNENRINKNIITDDILKLLTSERDKNNFIKLYDENIKNNLPMINSSQKNFNDINQRNKSILLFKLIKENNRNITDNSNNYDKSKIKDIINKNDMDIIMEQLNDNNLNEEYEYKNVKEKKEGEGEGKDNSKINDYNYINKKNKFILGKNDDIRQNINSNNISSNININNSRGNINTNFNNLGTSNNINNINNINNKVNNYDNKNTNNKFIYNNINNKEAGNNRYNKNDNGYFINEDNVNENKENNNKYLNKEENINSSPIQNNHYHINEENKEKGSNYDANINTNKNANNFPQINKKEMNNINNINNIPEISKPRNSKRNSSLLMKANIRNNSPTKNKRRSTYIINPSKNNFKKKSIKKDVNIDINTNKNIIKEKSQKNKLILSDNSSEKEHQEKSSMNTSENDDVVDLPTKSIKRESELDKILFKKKIKKKKRRSKTTMIRKRQSLEEEEEEENEDDDEFKFLKMVNDKRINVDDLDSILNTLNFNDNDFIINNEFGLTPSKSLSKEDMNKLILFSSKLRSLSELKDKNKDNKEKIDELTQMENDIKQQYYEIINKYLMKQKYKNLTKDKKINVRFRRKSLKMLFQGKNENQDETPELKNKRKKKKKILNTDYVPTKIEDSEDESLSDDSSQSSEKEETKKLIYDNSYLFKKNKKEKKISIKNEVLDILNPNNKSNNNNNQKDINNASFEYNSMNNLHSRKKNYKLSTRRNKLKTIRKIFRQKKVPIDVHKMALFTDIDEEIIEKIKEEEDDKEKILEEKLEMFFKAIQKMKENGINEDYLDFLENEETKGKECLARLNEFNENMNYLKFKDKKIKSKLNFLSPIQFKTKNL